MRKLYKLYLTGETPFTVVDLIVLSYVLSSVPIEIRQVRDKMYIPWQIGSLSILTI